MQLFLKILMEWLYILKEQSDLGLHCLHRLFCQKLCVLNFRMFTIQYFFFFLFFFFRFSGADQGILKRGLNFAEEVQFDHYASIFLEFPMKMK